MSSNISKYFTIAEIQCHCNCGQAHIDKPLYQMADALRDYLGSPMITHCVNRCIIHNENIGGVTGSLHISGHAMDFHCKGITVKKLRKICKKLWKSRTILTGGLGVYSWGIHIDTGRYRTWKGE